MAKIPRKHIAVLFAGGTLLSTQPRAWERVRSLAEARRWLENVPELHVVADVEPVFITNKSSQDIGPSEWIAMGQAVRERIGSVDGFVILHGIETADFTANILSLMLQSLPLPVVVSGSPIPGKGVSAEEAEFGARANVLNAAQVAISDIAEVCVAFGNRIIRGSHAQVEAHAGSLQVTSFQAPLLGYVDFGTKLFPERIRRSKRKPKFAIYADPNVVVTTLTPGAAPIPIASRGLSALRGIVVRMPQGYVGLSERVLKELEAAALDGIIVVASSSRPLKQLPSAFIPLVGLSSSMSVAKLMWALGAAKKPVQTRGLVLQDVAGEFSLGGGEV